MQPTLRLELNQLTPSRKRYQVRVVNNIWYVVDTGTEAFARSRKIGTFESYAGAELFSGRLNRNSEKFM